VNIEGSRRASQSFELSGAAALKKHHISLLLSRNVSPRHRSLRAAFSLLVGLLFVTCALVTSACSNDPPAHTTRGSEQTEEGASRPPGFSRTSTGWAFTTTEVELPPGQERYVCYVGVAPDDMVIGAIRSPNNDAAHHFLLVQLLASEPEGFRECDVIFQLTWAPLYAATRADAALRLPAGSAKTIKQGTQLLLQVHLLNATKQPVKRAVSVLLDTTHEMNPREVGLTLFGSTVLQLPPGASLSVQNTCETRQDLHVYALFPHMHKSGRKMELEVGKADGSFETIYQRNPFDYDDQYMDSFTHTIPAGSRVRVRCSYENPTDQLVGFGEGAQDEMCFAIAFTVDGLPFQFCSEKLPPIDLRVSRDPAAGVCDGAQVGIGEKCTPKGGECASDLFCSASLLNMDVGVCFRLGCDETSPCGTGNTCCTFPNIGNMANICIPEACRPDFCIPITHPY